MGEESQSQRVVSDCRDMPSEKNCSLSIEGTKDEVLRVAVDHAIKDHGHDDSPKLREEVETMLKPAK